MSCFSLAIFLKATVYGVGLLTTSYDNNGSATLRYDMRESAHTRTITLEGGMVGQKSRRNSGFLPPLAADRVYDHNGAVPSTVRHAMLGGRRKGLREKCPPACFREKNIPIQQADLAWCCWPLAALEIT